MSHPDDSIDRRRALKTLAAGGVATALSSLGPGREARADETGPPNPPPAGTTMAGVPFDKHDIVRIAIVGTGLRGRSMLHEWLGCEGVAITALCDVVPDKARMALEVVKASGQRNEPALYTQGERDFERLCQRDDVDLVYTATPWPWHVPVCLAALKSGKHAATEVPAAYTLEDCWALVDASEKTRRHCVMMENCNYGYTELLVLNLVRAGVLGEVFHGGAAYNHDLREILFEDKDEGLWRRTPHTRRNGNLYPTHGLGPVAMYFDVNRGDRFETMVSMSTGEFGLTKWRADHIPNGNPKWGERYVTGDLNISLIRTARGRTVRLEHDVTSPRPYSRINSVQGTKGIFEDYPPRIYLEGQPGGEAFGPIDGHKAQHEHPLWRTLGERARSGGHGGMDFVMAWRFVQCMREGLAPDMDVYDAAAWSAPGPLSELSVARGSAPVRFPDFTRGHWSESRKSF